MAGQKQSLHQSWFHGLNAIVASVVAILTLCVAVFALLWQTGLIGGSEPRLISLTNSEAKPGEQIRIPGDNLGPVNEVVLFRETSG